MADLTRVAEVLAAHGETTMTVRGWCCYGCGASYGRLGSTLRGQRAAHQAQMLADAGLVASETEWGHVADGYLVEEGASEEGARRGGADDDVHFPSLGTWPARVVRREVTPWVAAQPAQIDAEPGQGRENGAGVGKETGAAGTTSVEGM